MDVISISRLTKDYGNSKGIFDISLNIKKGEVYGYLGPNGAGKSTTIRHLMGFSRPQSGTARILGLDCWKQQKEIQKKVGYLPGEIAFPDDMTGLDYLRLIAAMRGMRDFSYAKVLLDYFDINPDTGLKRMSKGMKQKIGIVSAFMHEPDILLLDEPSSGLDPLMQSNFINLIEKVKSEGKTVILSSHIFEEVEKTCDRIGMIKDGRLIKEFTVDQLRHSKLKTYKIEFKSGEALEQLSKIFPKSTSDKAKNQMVISISDSEINSLISHLSKYELLFLKEEKHTLEEYFMQLYGGEDNV